MDPEENEQEVPQPAPDVPSTLQEYDPETGQAPGPGAETEPEGATNQPDQPPPSEEVSSSEEE